jgi:hypothetical protein
MNAKQFFILAHRVDAMCSPIRLCPGGARPLPANRENSKRDDIDIGWYEVQGLTFDLVETGPLFSHTLLVDVQ